MVLAFDLERALLRELADEHRRQSAMLFRDQLRPVVVRFVDADGKLGEWDLATRTISFARRFVVDAPWGTVVEVLKHEMAHQYAHEVLGAVDEPAHGPAFRRVCDERGIDPAAAGLPAAGLGDDDRVLRKVAKLLALAGSANVHEAQSAAQKAQKLMLEHAIDAARLDGDRGRVFVQLGAPKLRVPRHEKILAHILVARFHVQAILVPAFSVDDGARGHVLEVCGGRAQVATAVYVHGFLLRTADRLWDEHRAQHPGGAADRLRFLAGVMRGFDEKLQAGEKQLAQEGLVWVGDARTDEWFHRRHPRIRRTRVSAPHGHAHESGRRAGRDIVLHKPVDEAPTRRGRLLS